MNELKRDDFAVEEIRYEYKGFPCVVLFMNLGHRCGYVGIPFSQQFVDRDLQDEISCHGGVTYYDTHLRFQDDENMIWIGFDTAHLPVLPGLPVWQGRAQHRDSSIPPLPS